MARHIRIDAVDSVPQPLIALGHDYPDGCELTAHHHRRGQLIFGETGVLVLTTPEGRWIMPPQHGLWIPPGVVHGVRMLGAVRTASLYLDPAHAGAMPGRCVVVDLPPLLRTLILKALDAPVDHPPDSHAGALMALIRHEMRGLTELPLALPMPEDAALAERCGRFLRQPLVHESIDRWCGPLGQSRRAFTRRFRQQTGLSFVEWRQRACLAAALPRLVAGEPVTTVALDLGYDNPAAFTAMFKRVLGAPPRAYVSRP